MVAVGVAEGPPIQVDGKKGEERRKPLLHRGQISIAGVAVAVLDGGKFGKRDQDLADSLDDLLLFRGGELGQAQCLVLELDLARGAQFEFVVSLDRYCRQQGYRDQHEQPR